MDQVLSNRSILAVLIVGMGIAVPAVDACAQTGDPVTARGLVSTTRDREPIGKAITHANAVLGASRHKLQASWDPPPTSGAIPVYLVAAPAGKLSTPAAVPRDCRCVFVDPAALAAWLEPHTKGSAALSIDLPYLAAFILLHEVGHIDSGHAAGQYNDGAWSQLNIEPSRRKAQEEAADDFAAGLIRDLVRTTSGTPSLTAAMISMQLTSLSWNMQAHRTIEEFGATATGKPSVFFDSSYSHPNLAWRILRSNHQIHGSADSKALLDGFEQARERGARQEPIFRKGAR